VGPAGCKPLDLVVVTVESDDGVPDLNRAHRQRQTHIALPRDNNPLTLYVILHLILAFTRPRHVRGNTGSWRIWMKVLKAG
jgi:hypothetical protein